MLDQLRVAARLAHLASAQVALAYLALAYLALAYLACPIRDWRRMQSYRRGGVCVDGGDVSMNGSVFEGTYEEKEGFSSVEHKVVCVNEGRIRMNGYNGERIRKNTSLWIMIGGCEFETGEGGEVPPSLLFTPVLASVRYNTANTEFSFSGVSLIPCNLLYEILLSNGSTSVDSAECDAVCECDTRLCRSALLPDRRMGV